MILCSRQTIPCSFIRTSKFELSTYLLSVFQFQTFIPNVLITNSIKSNLLIQEHIISSVKAHTQPRIVFSTLNILDVGTFADKNSRGFRGVYVAK